MIMRMTSWLTRFSWKLRGRRYVRLQIIDGTAIDGVFLGTHYGHYRLIAAFLYPAVTNAPKEELIGETWVPRDRVLLLTNVRV